LPLYSAFTFELMTLECRYLKFDIRFKIWYIILNVRIIRAVWLWAGCDCFESCHKRWLRKKPPVQDHHISDGYFEQSCRVGFGEKKFSPRNIQSRVQSFLCTIARMTHFFIYLTLLLSYNSLSTGYWNYMKKGWFPIGRNDLSRIQSLATAKLKTMTRTRHGSACLCLIWWGLSLSYLLDIYFLFWFFW